MSPEPVPDPSFHARSHRQRRCPEPAMQAAGTTSGVEAPGRSPRGVAASSRRQCPGRLPTTGADAPGAVPSGRLTPISNPTRPPPPATRASEIAVVRTRLSSSQPPAPADRELPVHRHRVQLRPRAEPGHDRPRSGRQQREHRPDPERGEPAVRRRRPRHAGRRLPGRHPVQPVPGPPARPGPAGDRPCPGRVRRGLRGTGQDRPASHGRTRRRTVPARTGTRSARRARRST